MSNEKIEGLRALLADESLPLAERRTAAELCIAALLDSVQEPAEDDSDVIRLRTPPEGDPLVGDLYVRAVQILNEDRGWAPTGPSLAQARRHIHTRRREELVRAIYKDHSRHHLERLEAAQRVLDAASPRSHWRMNGYTAQRIIEESK